MYFFLEDKGDEFVGQFKEELEFGESGAAIEYYFCNHYYCINGIVKFKGNLDLLLNKDLYIGHSLLKLKRIIEKKLRIVFKKEPNLYINKASYYKNINYKKIKKKPNKMIKYEDIGLIINV